MCILCRRERDNEYKKRPDKRALVKAYKQRHYRSAKATARRESPAGREQQREWAKNYRAENKAKSKAHKAVEIALKNGHMARGNCSVCGTDKEVEGHHPDYTKPLEVTWLCIPHHQEEHIKLRESITPPGGMEK